jgi:hypothetical protein
MNLSKLEENDKLRMEIYPYISILIIVKTL